MADQEEAPKPCWSNILKSQPAPNPSPNPSAADSLAGVFAGSCKSTKGITVAVVDANAIIAGGERLSQCADKFVSVPEVMDEIRDPVSRHRLAFVPFTVQTTEPSPESLSKVTKFARATGDLQTLSDVDIKLIALTYTLESQIHGTAHLRDCPPPIHTVHVRRLPEKDLPGWGSNVPNLEEWEALEDEEEDKPSGASRILPLRDLNLNVVPDAVSVSEVQKKEEGIEVEVGEGNDGEKPKRFPPKKKEISIDAKKMVIDGIDASNGEVNGDEGDWMPAVSRSSQRRYHKRQARREFSDSQSVKADEESLASKLEEMRLLEEESLKARGVEEDIGGEEIGDLEEVEEEEEEMLSEMSESVDGASSEQSWTLRSLSESSVACITSDFAMQNVLLQMGLRLVAPGGMQIRKLQRWVLRCHACYTVTPEVEKIFCPKCGNGGTLRKVAVTVGENGVTVAARRPRVSLRGTKFSLPLPQGGREAFTKNLILREDQLPQKYLHPKTKKKAVKKDEGDDFFIGRSDNCIFSQHHCDKKSALQPPVRKALQVFSGKRNPNDNHYSRSMHK